MNAQPIVGAASPYDVASVRRDFPILATTVRGKRLAFLDTAASSQRPLSVIEAVNHYERTSHANVHRGVYQLSQRATDAFEGARERVRRFLNAASIKEVVFTRGTTEAINLVAQSWGRHLAPGDEILITWMEHHANIVPWQMLCERTGAVLKVAPIDRQGELDLEGFKQLLSPRTRLAAFTQISNSLGTMLPIEDMVRAARAAGALTLIDGAQAVAHQRVDVQALDCDFYVFSSHKLYGPTGLGVLWAREAVLRELKRGGQVYFLHNEVETIENRRQQLEAYLPEARIAIAHGQMPERQLEQVMRDFVAQRFNILLCSTIIETGIDVPTANTIVMARADKFGLAQLHQLRGRVGRSHHQAYAYLLVPDTQSLTKQAKQRLEAIQEMEELGSGFYLAMHDLEIRGAGEVLGENQSGNMLEIGFQLYNEMLAEAVASLKAGREPDLLSPMAAVTDINLHVPALLPNDYCGDVHLRLSFYKKLATAKTTDQIDRLMEEIADRFGKLPPQAVALVDVHRLRVLCAPYGIVKVDAAPTVINISFKKDAPIDPGKIIELIQKHRYIKLAGNDKLRIEKAYEDPNVRVHMVRDVLRHLGQPQITTAATPIAI